MNTKHFTNLEEYEKEIICEMCKAIENKKAMIMQWIFLLLSVVL